MKRIFSLIIAIFSLIILSACNKRPVLYILNWSEYMNDEVVTLFEKEHGVRVVLDTADTNEIMYTKIKAKTTKFDVAIPSDYMIHKLYNEGLLVKFNRELLPNYQESSFDPQLQALRNEYFTNNQDYAAPYFWGSLGIMYNTLALGLEEIVKTNDWRVFFDSELTKGYKVGMYNSSRDAIAAAEFYLGYSLDTTDIAKLDEVQALLKAQKYHAWGTDNLKTMVSEGNLDIALVYSGDFFDILYATMEDNLEVTYNMHVPNNNNVWFDAMVIPSTSQKQELAHEFINFMLDPENAYLNATAIGYCPTITSSFNKMASDPDFVEIINNYPYYPGVITNPVIYRDLGSDIYQKFELILVNAKGK